MCTRDHSIKEIERTGLSIDSSMIWSVGGVPHGGNFPPSPLLTLPPRIQNNGLFNKLLNSWFYVVKRNK